MRRVTLGLFVVGLVSGGVARADEPVGTGTPPPLPDEGAPPDGEVPPVREETPPPPPPRERHEHTGGAHEGHGARRPEGYSIGIGAGYDLPADLQAPNTVSARFRMHSGLTFEPNATLGASGTSQDQGATDTSTSTLEITLGTQVRWPLKSHGPVDLVAVGGGGVSFTSTDPDGDSNNSSSMSLFLDWGIGLEYWPGAHWAVSFTATNPFVTYTSTSMEQALGGDTGSSSYLAGAIWDPNVVLALHLFL